MQNILQFMFPVPCLQFNAALKTWFTSCILSLFQGDFQEYIQKEEVSPVSLSLSWLFFIFDIGNMVLWVNFELAQNKRIKYITSF